MPYRHLRDVDLPDLDDPGREGTMREDLFILVMLLVFSAGPIVSYLIFGVGSGIEMGIGAVLSLLAAHAVYRTLRPAKEPPSDLDSNDDDGADGSDRE